MSRGIGAYAELAIQDDETVIYEYGSYDLDRKEYANRDHIMDGIITIQKCCFQGPEIHRKLKRFPSGRKRFVVKKVPVSVDYPKYIEDGLISVENCSNCWNKIFGEREIDDRALRLLFRLFYVYQEEGKIPKYFSIHY